MQVAELLRNGFRKALKSGLLSLTLLFPVAAPQAFHIHDAQQTRQLASIKAYSDSRRTKARQLTNYISEKYRVPLRKVAIIVIEAFHQGAKFHIEPELILAIIAVESTFREKAVSRMGARGLMQVMPRHHLKKVKEIGGVHALFEPGKNIATGSRILVNCLDDSRGNVKNALLRYNGSFGKSRSRYADKVLRIYRHLKQISTKLG